jgi:hypothetical protein
MLQEGDYGDDKIRPFPHPQMGRSKVFLAVEKELTEYFHLKADHESREDTVFFPALRTILTPSQVAALGDKMEEDEHKVLVKWVLKKA